jgi:putative ABC transport system permease protein
MGGTVFLSITIVRDILKMSLFPGGYVAPTQRWCDGSCSRGFAMAAVLLAALGVYSVVAFSAVLRVQEMAIRIALWSQRSGILRLVFVSAAKLAVAGCAIGLAGAAAASRLLGSFLFGVSPFDPLVLTLAAVFVLLLASLASLLPALRAASIDLMSVLRAG